MRWRPTDDTLGMIGIPHSEDWQFRRLAAMTEKSYVRDPWSKHFPQRFHLTGKQLLTRAASAIPSCPLPTVSGFTAWIYSLYLADPDVDVLKESADIEEDILEARRDWSSYSEFRHFKFSPWHQVHCGMGSVGAGDRRQSYLIPDLSVNGQSLRANPDLVFIHEDDGQILIIEIKFSMARIPYNLWPNVWAQLWAYSKIPELAAATRVSVVGEVWGQNAGRWRRNDLCSPVYLRAAQSRDPRESKFDAFFSKLFSIYSSG